MEKHVSKAHKGGRTYEFTRGEEHVKKEERGKPRAAKAGYKPKRGTRHDMSLDAILNPAPVKDERAT